jgi:predicted MFS family arabinose efflux permease
MEQDALGILWWSHSRALHMRAAMANNKVPSREARSPDSKYSDQLDSDCPDLHQITGITVLAMAVASGISVANLYYSQPLLGQMGQTFGVGHAAGYIPAFTLIGLILGMVLFVPLGDMFERRSLIVAASAFAAVAAAAVALAPNFACLAIASLLLGSASIVQHLILLFAAQAARSQERGKIVGIVLSGMILGTLLARTVSGFVAAELGWRMMYWIATTLMITLTISVNPILPECPPSEVITYRELLRSLITIVREQPLLRESSLIGAMMFGALNAFWVSLIFFLEAPPYHYGERAAGFFGLVGAIGAAAAPVIGRLSDSRGANFGLNLGLLTLLISFIGLWIFGHVLFALIVGVIFLDAGVQASQVSNQTKIYSLLPEAPSRVNTVYMTSFFGGGALGASLGAYGWGSMQWRGVCIVGIGMLLVALSVHLCGSEEIKILYSRARNLHPGILSSMAGHCRQESAE